jgi:hypothetical protein
MELGIERYKKGAKFRPNLSQKTQNSMNLVTIFCSSCPIMGRLSLMPFVTEKPRQRLIFQ